MPSVLDMDTQHATLEAESLRRYGGEVSLRGRGCTPLNQLCKRRLPPPPVENVLGSHGQGWGVQGEMYGIQMV